MGLERGRQFLRNVGENISWKAFGTGVAVAGTSLAADRLGINWAAQHGLTTESGFLDVHNSNNFWDTLMLSTPTTYLIYHYSKDKIKKVTRKASLALSAGLAAVAMIPGAAINIASETPAINNTYVMQEVLPKQFHSEPGTINIDHETEGFVATVGEGLTVYVSLRRRRKDAQMSQATSANQSDT